MSFIAQPPRRLFFTCLLAPAAGSGETPLADFRKVLRDVDPRIRRQLEARGLRIVRNYAGPGGGGRFDLWKLKRWDEMFLSTDRRVVEAKCRAEGFEPIWLDGGGLRLISTQPITRRHPVTGEEVWHNHSTTFHLSTAPGEYARIYRLRPTPRNWFFWTLEPRPGGAATPDQAGGRAGDALHLRRRQRDRRRRHGADPQRGVEAHGRSSPGAAATSSPSTTTPSPTAACRSRGRARSPSRGREAHRPRGRGRRLTASPPVRGRREMLPHSSPSSPPSPASTPSII